MNSGRLVVTDFDGMSPGVRRGFQLVRRFAKGIINQINEMKEKPGDYSDMPGWVKTFLIRVVKRSAGALVEFVDDMDETMAKVDGRTRSRYNGR